MSGERRRPEPGGLQQAQTALQTSHPTHISVKFFNTRNLAIIVTGLVFIVALIKAQRQDVPQIVQTICSSRDIAIIGWGFAVFILVVAIALLRIVCSIYDKEMDRLVKERDRLQEKLLANHGARHEGN